MILSEIEAKAMVQRLYNPSSFMDVKYVQQSCLINDAVEELGPYLLNLATTGYVFCGNILINNKQYIDYAAGLASGMNFSLARHNDFISDLYTTKPVYEFGYFAVSNGSATAQANLGIDVEGYSQDNYIQDIVVTSAGVNTGIITPGSQCLVTFIGWTLKIR